MELNAKRGEPWFDDGNIVLVTDENSTAFRVHRGVLGRHSEVFQGMFGIPQPISVHDLETYEGCQIVRVYDLPSELGNLITALYDGATFYHRNFEDFLYLAGILRLSTKYLIPRLRTQCIRFLTETWPYTLQGHDAMVSTALKSPSTDNLTYPYVHPLHVLNLANEVNVRIVIPSAVYFLSLYPLPDLLRGDHPKLVVNHPSSPSSALNPTDITAYTLMFQHRLTIILDFVRRFFDERAPATACTTEQACMRGFGRLASRLSRSWMTRTGPLYYMVQAVNRLSDESSVCEHCLALFHDDVEILRAKLWKDLPSIIGLPHWEDLEAADLSH
ncbi:hypothetical protein Hypma_000780 [Hypsizygus marmoreus]|uniref:BTB domain-containing protein n=1 Tax=Hypsizygus marmoreus TaxID=39966 RepID=A0A369J7S4_HYPMA|nr:hypothetical protein Hypma_000780 [Hypsizygus marmoreus]